jgi:hypothetical protein
MVHNMSATSEEKVAASDLAERKLSGLKLREAKAFIWRSRRSKRDVAQLVSRLEFLPDLPKEKEPVPNGRPSIFGPAMIRMMQADRKAGMSYGRIAKKYSVSYSTAYRKTCAPECQPEEKDED